jgi:membrane-associated phospholipid phosphatase
MSQGNIGASGARERNYPAALLRLCLLAAAVALSMAFLDDPLARWARDDWESVPKMLQSLLDAAKYYGQGFGVIFVFLLIFVMDPKRRRQAVQIVIAMLLVVVVTFAMKSVAGRARPHHFLTTGETWAFLRGAQSAAFASMPSAHAAGAFALTAVLVHCYPKVRRILIAAAFLCAISRITDLQHYLSDVILGSAVGAWIGMAVFRWQWTSTAAEKISVKIAPLLSAVESPVHADQNRPSAGPKEESNKA